MKRKKIDVLLIARPDHSYQIYQALSAQKELTFRYVTFGLLPQWLSFLKIPKARYVGGNTIVLKWFTLLYTLYCRLHFTKRFDERKVFEKSARLLLRRYDAKVIHYWPDYCAETVRKLKNASPDAVTLAEMYMPNPLSVIPQMKRVYEDNDLVFSNRFLDEYAERVSSNFDCADYICVPSKYVEQTMKATLSGRRYIVSSYGIQRSPYYTNSYKHTAVRCFAYAGAVSLEKGVDIICDFFSDHSEYELHIFGPFVNAQEKVFEKYRICSNIVFHGAVSRNELYESYLNMDAGIHPSRFDAYSLAVGEQIGAGLPVIVSDKTGNKDDIIKNNWGLVFSLDEPGSLDKAINEMISPERYNSFKSSIDHSLKNDPTYGDRILKLYRSFI